MSYPRNRPARTYRPRRPTRMRAARAGLLLGLGLSLTACGGGLIRSGSTHQEGQVEQLQRQILELRRRATVGEVEARRLQQEVERLRSELAARDAAAEAASRAAAETTALGRVAEQPIAVGTLIDELPIEEVELELEPQPAQPSVAAPIEEIQRPDRRPAERAEAAPVPRIVERFDPAQTLYDEAYTLFHQQRYAEAEASFRQLIERFADSELADNAQFWIGECRYARGDFSSALAAFTTTVQRYPAGNKVPDAMLKAGKCLEALGDLTRAKESYREVVAGFPGSSAAAHAEDRLNALR